jgi:deoxycytidylate deaminase
VGVLAKTILAIEDNEKTEFLDKILEKWKLNRDEINSKNTYHYLKKVGKEDNNIDLLAKTSILKECNNLLGELLIQKT